MTLEIIETELLKADGRIRGDDPVAIAGTVDVAECLGVVDGTLVVTADVVDGVPGAIAVGVTLAFVDVLGFASQIFAESVSRVVVAFLSRRVASVETAFEGARVRNASTSLRRIEGVLAASEGTEAVDEAVGAGVSSADLGGIQSKAIEVGAATFVGAGGDSLCVPSAASLLVALIALIDLRAVFGGDSELGADEGGRITNTVEDLVIDVGKIGVGEVVGGRRAGEAHEPLLVLEIFRANLSVLSGENLSREDGDSGTLKDGGSVLRGCSIRTLAVSQNEEDLLATSNFGCSKDGLSLLESRSDNSGVSRVGASVVFNVVVDIGEELGGVTGESSFGTVGGVGHDVTTVGEFDESKAHAKFGSDGCACSVGNSTSERSIPDPRLDDGIEGEPSVR